MAGIYRDYITNAPPAPLPFIPGTGSSVQFAQCIEVLVHPTADKFYYIADNYGVRIMCMW